MKTKFEADWLKLAWFFAGISYISFFAACIADLMDSSWSVMCWIGVVFTTASISGLTCFYLYNKTLKK